MKATEYKYTGTLTWEWETEDDVLYVEFEVDVIYSVSPYVPARGPSYSSGGEPEEPAMIEDVDIVTIDGKSWREFAEALPFGLTPWLAHIALTEKLLGTDYDQMMDAAAEADEPDWDAIREDREEDARYWASQNWDD